MTVVVRRGTGKSAAPPQLHSRGFSEDPKALEPAAREGRGRLEKLAAEVTDVTRIAQAARRASANGWGSLPASADIVPTVMEILTLSANGLMASASPSDL